MLRPENRLTKIRDFNLVIKHGRFFNDTFITLKALNLNSAKSYFPPKEDPEKFIKQLRLAFSVGLKISKSAVKRNRFRRQLREVIRIMIQKGAIQNNWYLLFVAKSGCLDKTYAEIEKQALELLKKAGAAK